MFTCLKVGFFMLQTSKKLEKHVAFGFFLQLSHFSCKQGILITFELRPLNLMSLLGLRSRLLDKFKKKKQKKNLMSLLGLRSRLLDKFKKKKKKD